jgi:predicted nucleic acid-binding protein
MILYLDTSCMVKLYIQEPGTEEVQRAAELADEVATSIVAEAELRSALARRKREGQLTSSQLIALKQRFREAWADTVRIPLTDGLSALAGDLTEYHGLRGFDAIHLPSALSVMDDEDGETWFYSADVKLNSAAKREGLKKVFPAGLS